MSKHQWHCQALFRLFPLFTSPVFPTPSECSHLSIPQKDCWLSNLFLTLSSRKCELLPPHLFQVSLALLVNIAMLYKRCLCVCLHPHWAWRGQALSPSSSVTPMPHTVTLVKLTFEYNLNIRCFDPCISQGSLEKHMHWTPADTSLYWHEGIWILDF